MKILLFSCEKGVIKIKQNEAITYLEGLERGSFLTVNIPIFRDDEIKITAMYMGKDKSGCYNFMDSKRFVFSREFLQKGKVTIDREYNGDEAFEVYRNLKQELGRKENKKKKENRHYR